MAPGSTTNSSGSLAGLKAAQPHRRTWGRVSCIFSRPLPGVERDGRWLADGCRDFAHWFSAQLGISNCSARRWVTAAEALPRLPGGSQSSRFGSFVHRKGARAVIVKALDRMAGRLPDIVVDEDDPPSFETSLAMRRADALVALASHRIAEDADADRTTVVVHVDARTLGSDHGGAEIEGGGVLGAETARRLACDGRIEFAFHDRDGRTVGVGRAARTPPAWLVRQMRQRDRGCTFPGCDARWFLHAHHIRHWTRGGSTDLDNLVLVCTSHHKLVHEYGWDVWLGPGDAVTWTRPDKTPFTPSAFQARNLAERAPPLPGVRASARVGVT